MQIEDKEEQFEKSPIELPEDEQFFVIVGGNNSGKSTLLRSIVKTIRENSYIVDVNRTILKGEGSQDKNYLSSQDSFLEQMKNFDDDNSEKPLKVLQDLFNLNNFERKQIIDWYNKYFPNRIYEERENSKNTASPMFLKINGFSITKQGSGIRATLEIFVKLFDPNIKILCIDEPEMGLEPYLQKYLFQALRDKAGKNKKIIIATHSHHFLDCEIPEYNYICERNQDNKIKLSQVKNHEELKSVIFHLLGNTLSSFMLPEKILIFEGISDVAFISKILKLLKKNDYAIHSSGGDGSVKYAINCITQFLKLDGISSVYKKRIWVTVDKRMKNTNDINIREWKKLLMNEDRIKILSKNGIEYYYPERIVQDIFQSNKSIKTIIDSYLKMGKFNKVSKSKPELAIMVASNLTIKDLDNKKNELFNFLKDLP